MSVHHVKKKIHRLTPADISCIRKISVGFRYRAFTLVELMLAVVIFSIGIIFVLQSFLAVGRAFGSSQHIFRAVSFLEERMTHVKEISLREEGVLPGHGEGEEVFDGFDFRWQQDLAAIEDQKEVKDLVQVTLSAQWQEGSASKNLSLITYLPLHVTE